MSEFMDKIYDQMGLDEVIYRLPSELAIRAIKRRVKTPEDLLVIFEHQDRSVVKTAELKQHVNSIICSMSVDDILDKVEQKHHPRLFSWLNEDNSNRILADGRDKLSTEFLFNLTKESDVSTMSFILNKILSDAQPKLSKISSVLNKIDTRYFLQLADRVLGDQRDYVKTSILCARREAFDLLDDTQRLVAIKALAKIPSSDESPKGINRIDFRLFKNLKPLERIMGLDKYLDYFPKFKKIQVFNPEPTEDEFKLILFAGCFEYNDLVEQIVKKYEDITKNEETKG